MSNKIKYTGTKLGLSTSVLKWFSASFMSSSIMTLHEAGRNDNTIYMNNEHLSNYESTFNIKLFNSLKLYDTIYKDKVTVTHLCNYKNDFH